MLTSTTEYSSEFLTEKEKDSEDYLVGCIDKAIAELVIEKDYLRKAYNYYNGVRDKEQFRHLEENFGIGNPTAIEFIPLIRRHIDALVGEHLQHKIKPKVTCKDKKTLKKIEREKMLAIYEEEMNTLKSQLHNNIMYAFLTDEEKQAQQPPVDKAIEEELAKLKEDMNKNFVSEFEKAAQFVITHLIQSKSVDLPHKLKILFTDILITGQCYYKTETKHKGEVPKIHVLNTFDVFTDRVTNSPYVKTCPRVVNRRWLYKDQVLNEYGHHFTDEDLKSLSTLRSDGVNGHTYEIRNAATAHMGGLVAGVGIGIESTLPYMDGVNYSHNLIPVYEVEWLTTNKVNVDGKTIYRMDRYKGVRIGGDIYVNMGRDEEVIRSIENPYECFTSINGVFYSDRNGQPYSLVLATANLQDKYDILHFYRDTLIANSGVKGDWLDVSLLPTFLGQSPAERLLKWKAYKKTSGVALINTAQEGRGQNHNTTFAGYDDTVDGNAIQAIQLAIQQTEDTCSAVTGVFRERLGNIEQRDAVSNVEVGIETSAVITKQYFQLMDNITTELLIDALNACKESYRDGMVGSIILGDKMQKIFTIQPKYFSFTDYDVHIADSDDITKQMQEIKAITMELIKAGQTDVDVVFQTIGTESMTEMKEQFVSAFHKRKDENNAIQQMQQQLMQAQEQMKQLQQQAQKLQSENESLKKKATEIDEKKVEYDYDIRKESNSNTKEFNNEKIELDKSRVELEKLQLFDESKDNDEIKNN